MSDEVFRTIACEGGWHDNCIGWAGADPARPCQCECHTQYRSPYGFTGKRMGAPGDGVESGFTRKSTKHGK